MLPLLRRYRWGLPAIIVLGTLSALSEGLGISLIIPFFQALGGSGQSASANSYVRFLDSVIGWVPRENRLTLIPVAVFAAIVAKNCLLYVNSVLCSWLNSQVGHRLRSGIFNQLLGVSYGFVERSESGKLLNTLTTETWRAGDALGAFVDLLVACSTILIFIALLLLISWPLTLMAAAAILVISATIQFAIRGMASRERQAMGANVALTARMLDGLAGMRVIRALGREAYEEERFGDASEKVRTAFFRLDVLARGVQPLSEVCYAGLFLAILGFTVHQRAALPTLFAFVFFLYRLQPHLKHLAASRASLVGLTSSVEDVISLLDRADKPYMRAGSLPFHGLRSDLTFDCVSFAYGPMDEPVLCDVSIRIPRGKTTAIVGRSGAGKTTLVNLIFRLYDVNAGEIRVDGNPLPELDVASWRAHLALAAHDSHVFSGTVRENIAYGRLEASPAEIATAAERANAHEFIRNLPQGYDTKVGDGGMQLSAGQRQRIVLARAFLRNADLLILDEATNALDSISERRIQTALRANREGRTVILVAHRLSTIDYADHIVVLERGRVVEQGTFEELLGTDGVFARLARLQRRRRAEKLG
jgi:ABC-type multidrug transport system fused ATPase/permease subunit